MECVLAPKDEFISEIVKENGTVFKLKISKHLKDQDIRDVYIQYEKEESKNEFIGRAYATNCDEKMISANWVESIILKKNSLFKIGELTIFDPFSFLDKIPDFKIKVLLEETSDDFEKLELTMMLSLQNYLNKEIWEVAMNKKD